MWSTPLKRIAADGTEYSLLLLDTEGIDAYDQTVCLCMLYLVIETLPSALDLLIFLLFTGHI